MLNTCVLDFFTRLFQDVSRKNATQLVPRSTGTTDCFWIDTLAIPVGRQFSEQRKRAIASMNQVYRAATHTVVLDARLMSIDAGQGYIEPAMSITLSGWMYRL